MHNKIECSQKFMEDINDPNSVFININKVFNVLPLAAVVDDKIFCVHGGIGTNIKTIDQIDQIPRPCLINHNQVGQTISDLILLDLLWSDPVSNETETENSLNNERNLFGNGKVTKFGINRIKRFLADNNLLMIIRSHESV